ncbi:regulatory protein [Streptomyces griseoaurantiacus M045]|jgi:transcriptional regulator with XRE-family HTH domain|uniref:Regulatory protein n=2 Tax=Streptomyces griseoaurantiacus TaxID=68213 RepID=F3NTR3_9ACTN|nr:regulatory protein [Streptomyces griseoaurantiacus M045]
MVTTSTGSVAEPHRIDKRTCRICNEGMSDDARDDVPGSDDTDEVLAEVGPRLRRIRKERGATLAALSEATGISVSTLSRLESGLRKPSLELLLPIARAHQVPLDELVGAPRVGDPRVRAEPIARFGRTYWPLTRQPGGLQAFKVLEPQRASEPHPRTHEGYEWLYVMSGKLRLVLGEHDVVLGPGEAAEFDTRVPHWFGSTGEGPAEFLSLFGPQGERMHVRARPSRRP